MRARVVTLRFDPRLEAFDDTPLQEFVKDKEVVSLSDHFFLKDSVPYLAVFVTYNLGPVAPRSKAEATATASSAAHGLGKWRKHLADEDLPLFEAVRDWRRERAKRDGKPPVKCHTIIFHSCHEFWQDRWWFFRTILQDNLPLEGIRVVSH